MSTVAWQQISAIFDQALELPSAERGRFAAKACGENRKLLAEVESLLAAHQRDDGFLDQAAGELAADVLLESGHGVNPGWTIGPYRVLDEMGRGGMGVVYRAEDQRLGRDVALKLLPPGLNTDERARRRLLAEARAASALDHPCICTIYDVGQTQEGSLYFVMSCYEGQTLAERLDQGPIEIEEILAIAKQVVAGLEHAHENAVIHRDVKPGNIFLTTAGQIKILDFGVARQGAGGLTDPGDLMGTVGYMSPEQVIGQDVDNRSDLWGFGVTLHQMLCGSLPFSGTGPAGLLNSIVTDSPATLPEGVPGNVAAIVKKLLSKQREDRYQDAKELLGALDASQIGGSSLWRSLWAKRRWLGKP